MQCEYCSKVYNRGSNLKYHQKNDKECLQLQEKPIPNHKCVYCEKNYTAKTLNRHMLKCNSKNEYYLKQELSNLTNELKQKEEELKQMSKDLKMINDNMSKLSHHLSDDIINKSISLYNNNVLLMEEMSKTKDDNIECPSDEVVFQIKLGNEEATTQNEEIENKIVVDDQEKDNLHEIIYLYDTFDT